MSSSRGALGARASGARSWSSVGAIAAATWVRGRGLATTGLSRWHIEIQLDVIDAPAPAEYDEVTATRFHLDIYTEEWGHYFCHSGRSSWIRVTDLAFVHGRDDHQLLTLTPPLPEIGRLVRQLEQKHAFKFRRDHALVRTNIAHGEAMIRTWLSTL
jgi:hypothetical protein